MQIPISVPLEWQQRNHYMQGVRLHTCLICSKLALEQQDNNFLAGLDLAINVLLARTLLFKYCWCFEKFIRAIRTTVIGLM